MHALKLPWVWRMMVAWGVVSSALAQGQLLINEILLNVPGSDTPHEYIELRGMPSYVIPQGTYFVGVEGDTNGNPGSVQNIFDLSGQRIGANGFLVLLQKTNLYAPGSGATALVNTGPGPGFGSGSASSIAHRGEGGQTELENASATFFLIRSVVPPALSQDIDVNDDGVPDSAFTNWVVLDSVGLLDADGRGDIAYAAINFRRNQAPGNSALASGTIVPISFTPSYIGRSSNTVGSAAADWVAGDIEGSPPTWLLDNTDTFPAAYASRPLSHIGSPNFGAGTIKGLVLIESGGKTELVEGGGTDSYTIGLNIAPAGAVVIRVSAPAPLRISTDGGATFGVTRSLSFNSTTPQTIIVRANEDNEVDTSPYLRMIGHTITSSADQIRYPLDLPLASLAVSVTDNDGVLLSELKVNPPGTNDVPFEYVELRGASDSLLTNVYLMVIEGNAGLNPGQANVVVDLSSKRLGENGLLVIAGAGHPYTFARETAVVLDPAFGTGSGALGNNSISFLLVASPTRIAAGTDLDGGDNGILEGLPVGARILDAVGWRDGNTNDIVYGGVMLVDDAQTPDAAVRFLNDSTPLSAAAWYYGDLNGTNGATVDFDEGEVSANFPFGTKLTPGFDNRAAPQVFPALRPLAGAIGDPTNPKVYFTLWDDDTSPELLRVTVTSTNAAVVPNANITIAPMGGGDRILSLEPIGVGYSLITVSVTDGQLTNNARFLYAASAQLSPNTRHHVHCSDASAAIAIDSQLMFVGDDENQIIRIYHRHLSGEPLTGFDMTPMLGLTDIENGRPREVDIEAATLVGRRIFWIGAHSHANIAEGRTNRSRVFATDWAGNGAASTLAYAGRYDYLKLDLVNWDVSNAHGKGANYFGLEASTAEGVNPKDPQGAGFNIEGLTMAPLNDQVGYVAFRAPIVPATNRTHALIVPVLNFASLAASDSTPGSTVFGAPIELDLYGRGIRSIERLGTNYLIVAGPPGDFPGEYPNDFRLYTWSGNPLDHPAERATDLTGLNPEAIVELPAPPWTPQSQIQLVSDSGRRDWYNDGTIAKSLKELNFKKFRTDWVTLGAINKPLPVMISALRGPNGVTVSWRSLAGERYRLQFKNALSDSSWTDIAGDVQATGPLASKLDPASIGTHRFYHVMLLP